MILPLLPLLQALPTTVPVFVVPATPPVDPNASTWTPASIISMIAALVAGIIAVISALKSNTAATQATNTGERLDRTNRRVDTLLLHTAPLPGSSENQSLSNPARNPLLPGLLIALGLSAAASATTGCQATQSAERLQYQAFREGIHKGTAPTLREHAEWSQAIAGDTNKDGHVTAEDGPAPTTSPPLPNLSNKTPEQRESWLAPHLEVPKQFESWYQNSRNADTAPTPTPNPPLGGP
jgi:hypothetical protein